MKKMPLSILMAVGFSSLVGAQALSPTQSYSQSFMSARVNAAVCAYDSACTKAAWVRGSQITIKRPRPELMEFYKPLRALIIQIGHQYGIDPVSIVAAPLAENTMNVNIKDKVQDEMDAQGLLDDDGKATGLLAHIYDKPMSLGPGQIYVFAAKAVEPLAAQIEGRAIRTKKEIKAALHTRSGALRYAAAILLDAQQQYAKAGVDISHRPDILATLYNIGRVKDHARNAKNSVPSPNYFGYWVGLNYQFIKEQLNLPSILDK